MTVAVGDILRFVAKTQLPGAQQMHWVWHQLVTAGTTEVDLVVLTALRDHLDLACDGLQVLISNIVDSLECELSVWDTVLNRFDGTAQVGWTTFNGTDTAEPFANSTAVLVKFFTAVGRRQARKYISGWTEPGKTGNSWSAAVIAASLAWSAILDDALVTGAVTCTPCTFNVATGSPLFETTELFNGVTAVDTFSSTQRRRKPGVGI